MAIKTQQCVRFCLRGCCCSCTPVLLEANNSSGSSSVKLRKLKASGTAAPACLSRCPMVNQHLMLEVCIGTQRGTEKDF